MLTYEENDDVGTLYCEICMGELETGDEIAYYDKNGIDYHVAHLGCDTN